MTDYVIVGGGIYGAAAAWQLSLRGASVLLIEARAIAAGASGGVGFRGVRANGRSDAELSIMRRAHELWPRWAEKLDSAAIFQRIGHLDLIELSSQLPDAETRVRRQQRAGIPSELVGQAELRSLEPFLSEQVIAAISCPLDGISDHTATTRTLAEEAAKLGCELRLGAVKSLHSSSGRVTSLELETDERVTVGRELALFVNAATNDLIEPCLGVRLPLVNVLPQALVTEPVDPVPLSHLVGHMSRRLHMKALPDRRIMITGGWLGTFDPATGRGAPTAESIRANLAEAWAVLPVLREVAIELKSSDRFEAITADALPVLDRAPGVSNLLVGAGFSGQGYAPAPAYVELLVDFLLAGKKPSALEPFAWKR